MALAGRKCSCLDGTAFSVGPNSSVVLDKFIYNPETAEGSLEVTARGLAE